MTAGETVGHLRIPHTVGTFVGSPQWVAGKYGAALEFNGTSDYVIHNMPAAQNFDNFTVAFWVKASSLGQGQWMSPFSSHTPNKLRNSD